MKEGTTARSESGIPVEFANATAAVLELTKSRGARDNVAIRRPTYRPFRRTKTIMLIIRGRHT